MKSRQERAEAKGAGKDGTAGGAARLASGRRKAGRRSRGTRRSDRVVLLGPQGVPALGLVGALGTFEGSGARAPASPIATITAGWREQEGEPDLVALGDPGDPDSPPVEKRDLGLYAAGESLAEADPDLVAAHKELQGRLKMLRRVYNRRLAGLMDAYRDVGEMTGYDSVLEVERAAALDAIRALDARHLERVAELRDAYEARWRPTERDAVRTLRERVAADLDGIDTVVIAGGHIATLLNRLRLFGLRDLLVVRNVVAWSAGAMAISERVVLFHDRPPWGAGNAEVFDRGLGLVSGVVPFPHGTSRLALDDLFRTGRLARRFAPEACVLLDPGTRLDWADGAWVAESDAVRLDRAGRQERFRVVAA